MKTVILNLFVISFLLNGCGSPKPSIELTAKSNTTVKKEDTKPKVPLWISTPDMNGYIGGVGVVKKMKNKKKQNYIARKIALANLQERKRVLTESDTVVTQGTDQKVQVKNSIKQTSSHFNDYETMQKAEYEDSEFYYVWMVIK